jgi:hypothetical protein
VTHQAHATSARSKAPANVGVRTSRVPAAGKQRRPISERDQGVFLEMLAAGWTVRAAARATGRDFRRFYKLRHEDEAFAAAWLEAYEQGTQTIEQEAYRRAVDGYDETTTDGDGNVLRVVRRYDSALLQILLKARRPDVYRDRLEVEGGQPVEIRVISAFSAPPADEIEGELADDPRELEEATSAAA